MDKAALRRRSTCGDERSREITGIAHYHRAHRAA